MKYKNTLQKDYENLIPTIKLLSLAAQFISGSTAAFGIYIVIIQKIPISIKAIAILITLILTTIIIGSFEGGIRKLFPYWVRQILKWCLNKNEESDKQKSVRIILFSMLCILLMPLVIGTSVSSWNASPDLIAFSSPKPEVQNLENINAEFDSNTKHLLIQFEKDLQKDSILFINHLQTLANSWDTKITAQEIQRTKYLDLSTKGHGWAAGSAAKIKNKVIPDLKIEKAAAIQELHTARTMKLDSLQIYKSTTLLLQQQSKTSILNNASIQNDLLIQKTSNSVAKWGKFLAILAIISTFFTLFCFTFIEAYKAGVINVSTQHPKSKTQTTKQLPKTEVISIPKSLVAHTAQPLEVTHNKTEPDFVSIDKLIKRTRMQWQRSLDKSKEVAHRENNRRKAKENITFLESIGVGVSVDASDETKLIIRKKEIA